ncbi:MAG: signal peptidase I [Bacteroidia bacterium]|nr:signal peptidase I [Bacteroidia bacterium]
MQIAWLKTAGLALLVFILLRLFFFELFMVNNRDMEGSYLKGDVLLVKKNPSNLHRGQILLLNYPLPDSNQVAPLFIQRLVGLPGDSLLLSDKTLFVNGEEQTAPEFQKHNYFIKSRIAQLDSNFLEGYGLNDGGLVSTGFDYSYALTKTQKEALEKDSLIESIKLKKEKKNMFDATCFPGSIHCNWNADQYGKIYVPKKNDSILIDTTIISLYEEIISRYEQNTLTINQDSIFINGQYSTSYKVKQNYYFTLGDNRDNAVDSRHWGFLPESCIRGKVLYRIKRAKP